MLKQDISKYMWKYPVNIYGYYIINHMMYLKKNILYFMYIYYIQNLNV